MEGLYIEIGDEGFICAGDKVTAVSGDRICGIAITMTKD